MTGQPPERPSRVPASRTSAVAMLGLLFLPGGFPIIIMIVFRAVTIRVPAAPRRGKRGVSDRAEGRHRVRRRGPGFGGRGSTAAVTAAELGASVAVFEKADLLGGTTAWSGGQAWVPNNPHMADVEATDSPDDALALHHVPLARADRRVARPCVRRSRARDGAVPRGAHARAVLRRPGDARLPPGVPRRQAGRRADDRVPAVPLPGPRAVGASRHAVALHARAPDDERDAAGRGDAAPCRPG